MATSPPRPVQGWRSAESRTAPHRHSGRRTESRSRCHLNGPNVSANRRADFRVLVECKVRHRMLQQHRAFAPLVRYAAILYCQTYPPRETLFCSIDTRRKEHAKPAKILDRRFSGNIPDSLPYKELRTS